MKKAHISCMLVPQPIVSSFFCDIDTIPLLSKSEISRVKLYSEVFNQVCVRPGRKPLDRFSHDGTQIRTDYHH